MRGFFYGLHRNQTPSPPVAANPVVKQDGLDAAIAGMQAALDAAANLIQDALVGLSDALSATQADLDAAEANVAGIQDDFANLGDLADLDTVAAAQISANAVTTAAILNSNVTLAKIANIAGHTFLGNATGSSAAPSAIDLDALTRITPDSGTNFNVKHDGETKRVTWDDLVSAMSAALGLG